jgi:NAD(P)-dependent dehydrogenase (short-subunit alcohol dehydrogenase family)
MPLLLKGKVAVVTGSTKGIGFAIAKEFAENNSATTIVCSRIHEQVEKAIKQISSGICIPFIKSAIEIIRPNSTTPNDIGCAITRSDKAVLNTLHPP